MFDPHDPDSVIHQRAARVIAARLAATRHRAGTQAPVKSGLSYRVVAKSNAPRSERPPRPDMARVRREMADLKHRYLN